MISVVIPLYNKDKSIHRTISRVLNQSFSDFELIIVNDGSTDKSLDVVNTIKDDRIRVVNKDNGGVSSARNVGIKEAKYEIIAFLDADDNWDSDYLEILHGLVQKYPGKVMYAQAYDKVWTDNRKIKMLNKYCKNKEEYVVEDYNKFIVTSPFICSSSVAINKKFIKQAGLFDESLSIGEDLDMWFRLAMCGSIVYSPIIKAHYMMCSSDTTGISLSGKIRKHIAYKAVSKYKSKYKNEKLFYKIVNTFILYGYISFLKFGDKIDAEFYRKEIELWRLSFFDRLKYLYYNLFY